LDRKKDHQEWAQSEIRDGKAEKRQNTNRVIAGRAAAVGRENTRGNSDGRANEKSQKSKLQGGGVSLEDDPAHGRLELEGLPQIAAKNLAEVTPILGKKRLVEAECVAQLRDLSRSRTLTEHLLDRIARDNVNQKENHGEHQPKGWERENKAMK
jgi:hypothetical protein